MATEAPTRAFSILDQVISIPAAAQQSAVHTQSNIPHALHFQDLPEIYEMLKFCHKVKIIFVD